MLTILKSTEQGLNIIETAVSGCWIHVVSPTPADMGELQRFQIPAEFLQHALDRDERPRTERNDGVLLIILRFPHAPKPEGAVPFVTTPLSIIVTETMLVTIAPHPTGFLQQFSAGHVRGLSTGKPTRFVLHLLGHIAEQYLACVREINQAVDALEDQLQRSLRNKEVLALLKYQKSLVYFTTALQSNELVLDRLQKGQLLKRFPEDEELLDDVLVEVRQAMEMTRISENILSQMMDAFASIISNNLNVVMKFLASVTIVLSVPTLIASLYGMNVPLPGGAHPLAFAAILGLSGILAVVTLWIFWWKDWL